MKIAIDIDDTVLNFLDGFFSFYKKHHNPSFDYKREKVSNYLFEDILGIDTNKVISLFSEFKKTHFFKKMTPLDGAKEAIIKLSKGNEIIFITARPSDLNQETKEHLDSLFPKHNFQIIHSHDSKNNKIKEKADFCKDLGIEVIIEDDKKAALNCAQKGIACFLIDQPWNRDMGDCARIMRVKTWPEIVEKVTNLK